MIEQIWSDKYKRYVFHHPKWGSVVEAKYEKGIIKKLNVTSLDPLTLDDTCMVEVRGKEYRVPIFYKCKAGCWSKDIGTLLPNGALKGAARAFKPDDEVIVLMDKNIPAYVIGHIGKPPQMCVDLWAVRGREAFERRNMNNNVRRDVYLSINERKIVYKGDKFIDATGYEPKTERAELIAILHTVSSDCLGIMSYDHWNMFFYIPVPPVAGIVRFYQMTRIGDFHLWDWKHEIWLALWHKDIDKEFDFFEFKNFTKQTEYSDLIDNKLWLFHVYPNILHARYQQRELYA